MEKNEIVFTILDNKYIIKCECLDNLIYNYCKPIYDENFASYYCNKVKIIAIYNNKNIIESTVISEYEYPLKKDSIMSLENFKKNTYYKTFLRAYININKINYIGYIIKDNGEIFCFYNDIIHFNNFIDIFNLGKSNYYATICCNGVDTCSIHYNEKSFNNSTYYLHNKLYYYICNIYNNKIEIKKLLRKKENNIIREQSILCDKKLNILKLSELGWNKLLYEENRNSNNKIINITEYNHVTDKTVTIYFNDNFKSIISNKDFPQDLLSFYKSNIEFNTNIIFIKEQLNKAKKNLINEQLKYI